MQGGTRLATTLFASVLCLAQCTASPDPTAAAVTVPDMAADTKPADAPVHTVPTRPDGQPDIETTDRVAYVTFRASEPSGRRAGKTSWHPRPP